LPCVPPPRAISARRISRFLRNVTLLGYPLQRVLKNPQRLRQRAAEAPGEKG
jgi:hypothetical protein